MALLAMFIESGPTCACNVHNRTAAHNGRVLHRRQEARFGQGDLGAESPRSKQHRRALA